MNTLTVYRIVSHIHFHLIWFGKQSRPFLQYTFIPLDDRLALLLFFIFF